MKFQTLFVTGWILVSITWVACDGSEAASPTAAGRPKSAEATFFGSKQADDVRLRAERAIDQADIKRSRFRSRIGPQPWPRDLPSGWPEPEGASVMADSNGREDGRLLLVDLPGDLDQAIVLYRRALGEVGFEVVRGRGGTDRHMLRAQRGDVEAKLRFFARRDVTRLEILFVPGRSGPRG